MVGGSHPCLRGVSSQRGSTCGGRGTSIRGPISSGRSTPTLLRQDLATWRRTSGYSWRLLVLVGRGAGKASPAGPEFSLYQRIAITPIIGVHEPGSAPDHVRAVPESVLSVAQTSSHRQASRLEGPSSVQKFGYDAAHVRFTVTERCPGDPAFSGPSMLWRAFETRMRSTLRMTPGPGWRHLHRSRATSSTSGSST